MGIDSESPKTLKFSGAKLPWLLFLSLSLSKLIEVRECWSSLFNGLTCAADTYLWAYPASSERISWTYASIPSLIACVVTVSRLSALRMACSSGLMPSSDVPWDWLLSAIFATDERLPSVVVRACRISIWRSASLTACRWKRQALSYGLSLPSEEGLRMWPSSSSELLVLSRLFWKNGCRG